MRLGEYKMAKVIRLWDNDITIYSPTHFEKIDKRTKKPHIIKQSATKSNGGYRHIGLTNSKGVLKVFLAHRIMYLSQHPEWDIFDSSRDNSVDHINQTPSVNDISNLRCVTNQENQFNRKAKGCSQLKSGRWVAYIRVNYKLKYLGSYDTEEEAHAAYLAEKARLHVIVGH